MHLINKTTLACILLFLAGSALAETVTQSYCPSDLNNKAVYTFKQENSLPKGWSPAFTIKEFNEVPEPREPNENVNDLPEGQYTFVSASLLQDGVFGGKLSCTYKLEISQPGSYYKGERVSTVLLSLIKNGMTNMNIDFSIGNFKNWLFSLNPNDHRLHLVCGSRGAKVTDCPFVESI